MKLVSVAEMRALEAAAFATGLSEAQLQQQAGAAVAEEVYQLAASDRGRVAILVGHGNNGRDGAVAASWLQRHGVGVDLVLSPRHAIAPDELAALRCAGAALIAHNDQAGVQAALESASVAVDALAGIGVKGPLREPLASLAAALNSARERVHVVALDLPSGVDADTGAVPGEAVWARTTVTLGGVKQGLLRFPAAERVGRLIPREIGIPSEAQCAGDLAYDVLREADLRALVPARPLDAHKYRFGRALIVAGSDHFPGAPVLSAGGAARIGAGLVTVASTREVRLNAAAHLPEVTFTETDVRPDHGAAAAQAIEGYLRSHNAVVMGPGLGRSMAITTFVDDVLRLRPPEHSIVLDADALVALAELDNWPRRLGPNAVLTPHAGELARLVGHELDPTEPAWVLAGRLACEWGCVLITKGPFTAVAAPDGRVAIWPRSNPALATGGTGDVLAGVTGGLLAQGLSAWAAAKLAVGVHALAAERLVHARQWRTLLASDLWTELPAVLQVLTRPG